MKKLFTLICAATMMAGAVDAQTIQRYDVTNKTEFNTAMDGIATLPAGSAAYVYIKGYVDVGTLKNDASGKMQPTLRNIHFIGVDDEETGDRATLSMEMQMPADNTEADGFSLHYENLKLRQSQGVWGNSKHLMNFKDAKKHYIDTLEFVNCELTELCRSLYRGEAQNTEDHAGAMKVLRMENCVVHNGSRQSNAMPMIYMSQPINEVIIRNNTFYDLTYLNGIINFGTMTEATGIKDLKCWFENNTVCAYSKSTLLNFNDKNGNPAISGSSEIHVKNNLLLFPYWADDKNNRFGDSKDVYGNMGTIDDLVDDGNGNMVAPANGILTEEEIAARIEKGTVLTGITSALVQLENNVVSGYKYQSMNDDIIPIGDTEEEFFDEFAPALTMDEVGFAWSDFTDAQQDMFQINIGHAVHSAGKNGAPLGDENNYTDQVIKIVNLTVKVEGSKSASVDVSPQKDAYLSGDKVTLTAKVHGNLNVFEGWSTGDMEPTLELVLGDEDVEITAFFTEMEYLAVWNLDQISSNNVVITPPAKPNYGDESVALNYARYITDEETGTAEYKTGSEGAVAIDGTKAAIQTRNNKVSGDVRNCYLIQTATAEFAKTDDGHADYLFIELPQGLTGGSLQFFVATDNVPYKTYNIEYTTDDATWTKIADFDMTGKAATNEWYPFAVEIPATATAAKVRIKGVEADGPYISDDFQALIDAGTNEVASEFLFVSEIILKGQLGGENGITTLQQGGATTDAPVYNLMGIRVNGQARGLFIQNGKKHIVK